MPCQPRRSFRLNFFHRTYKALFSLTLHSFDLPTHISGIGLGQVQVPTLREWSNEHPISQPDFFLALSVFLFRRQLHNGVGPLNWCGGSCFNMSRMGFFIIIHRSNTEKSLLVSQSCPLPTGSALSALIMSSSSWLLASRAAQLLN